MSSDLTAVVVAVVGIAGTLGASVFAQYATTRDKRLDLTNQRDMRAEVRQEVARAAKQAIYVHLNTAARNYRTVGHDYLVDILRGTEELDFGQIEIARAEYRDGYSQAQMILPDGALKVASEVNECLGQSYRALRDVAKGSNSARTLEDLHQWYDGSLSDAVRLLRYVLREDLGVAEPGADVESIRKDLQRARLDLRTE
jgi:hypothetical protein